MNDPVQLTYGRLCPRSVRRSLRARTAPIVRLALLMGGLLAGVVSSAAAQTPMRFGVDVASASRAIAEGMPMTYGSLWAGSWNQRWGWDGIRAQLNAAKASGVTPVVHWWYWGDDISPACVEQGCWDSRQGVQKDKATWYRMSGELADLVATTLGPNSNAVIIVETEFNKNGIESYEPFDGYLVEHAAMFQNRGLSVVLGFGSWGQSLWPTFERAAAAADMLGTMVLQSSVRDGATYLSGADLLIGSADRLRTMFGKPVFVTDVGFSSYPESSYLVDQDTVIKTIFARLPELKAAGVQGMVWRMLSDDPTFDTSNYHGMAERFWGLLRADGSRKPGFTSFLNGMLAERAAVAPSLQPPGAAALASPEGGIATALPTYQWTAVSAATYYLLWADDSSGNRIRTWYTAAAAGCGAGTGTCAVTPAVSLANGAGAWWVQTWNPAGSGPWSAGKSFTLAAPPAIAQLRSPLGTIHYRGPAFTWNAVSAATFYRLWVQDASGKRIDRWFTSEQAGCVTGTGACVVRPGEAMAAGAGAWWVQTWSPASGYGAWSAAAAFDLQGAALTGVMVVGAAVDYTWNRVAGATDYLLWVADGRGRVVQQWYSASDLCNATSCTARNGAALTSGGQTWWVLTWSSTWPSDGYGTWSASSRFEYP